MAPDKTLLRVLSCGSVDDGKSTLIGRILYDCGTLYEDQLSMLEKERTEEGLPDFSCLLDGLLAEREQAITIDVAYRSFTTEVRRFLVADAPGHEQYTRNMATGASHVDVAMVLIDALRAQNGLLPQTRRHTYIASLFGVPDIIVAVNKMDRCGYSQSVFASIEKEYRNLVRDMGFRSVTCIPVSALHGDTVCRHGANMPWYQGPCLLEQLESITPVKGKHGSFRMPVQWVARTQDFRGLSGTVVSGEIAVGNTVHMQPSGTVSSIKRIVTADGELMRAEAEQAVCIELSDDLDVSRGEVLSDPGHPLEVATQFAADIVWLNNPDLVPGRSYGFRIGTAEAVATVTRIASRLDLESLSNHPARQLAANDIGRVNIALDRPLPLAKYAENRDLGGFLLVDRVSGNTLGAGMIVHMLRRSHTVHWHDFDLDKAAFAARNNQKPCVYWFTGLSASGKSTLVNLMGKALYAQGRHIYILDGDNLRYGLNRDLGFTETDRAENVRRAAEVAKLMVDAGLIVLAAFISPYKADRNVIRERFEPGEFLEIFVDTPLEICAARDPKGLYKRAMAGELPNFTGISAPFEAPDAPDLHLDGTRSLEELTEELMLFCERTGATHA
jgi:sulfate adenylyltransferase, large subunit